MTCIAYQEGSGRVPGWRDIDAIVTLRIIEGLLMWGLGGLNALYITK
jgi:hypothetical protein